MKRSKEEAKTILARVKAMFAKFSDSTSTDGAGAGAAGDGTNSNQKDGSNIINYNVDKSTPVFVDISDDSISDIDEGDMVYTDQAMSTPYPDGTYTITGTDFSFTVVSGKVTATVDPNGTGAGTPNAAAAPDTTDTATADTTADDGFAAVVNKFSKGEATVEDLTKMFAKFATGTPEERIVNLEIVCKALMEYNFGWKIQEAQAKQTVDSAINVYNNDLKAVQVMAKKHESILPELLQVVSDLVEQPAGDPETLTGGKKDKFERVNKREKTLEKISDNLRTLREESKNK
jgi:hypothetical protein